jgi:hypothetical protein
MSQIETFRYITYSDPDKFVQVDNRIELKEYIDDINFYVSFDSTFNANYSEGDVTASVTGTATLENGGVFGQFGYLQNATVKYNVNNFANLTSNGCLKFRIRPTFNNAYGNMDFNATTNPIIVAVPVSDIAQKKFGGASLNLLGGASKNVKYNVDNVAGMLQTGTIDFFFKLNYTGAPSTNVGLIDIRDAADNNNRIVIYHGTDGRMHYNIFDQTGALIVDINFAWAADTAWHNTELCFDINAGASRAFVDGTQYGTTNTGTGTRVNVTDGVYVGSVSTNVSNQYMDDVAFFSTVWHTTNYAVRTAALAGTEVGLVLYGKYDTNINLAAGAGTLPAISTTPSSNNYKFKLYVDNVLFNGTDTSVSLVSSDTMTTIWGKLETAITGSGATSEMLSGGNIRVKSTTLGIPIRIEAPSSGDSLITLLGGVTVSQMRNGPVADVNIIDFYNESNNYNRITLTHTTTSHLFMKMYDSTGTLKVNQDMGLWNNFQNTWYAFEFNWNPTIGQFYIDGSLFNIFMTGFSRGGDTRLILKSGVTDFYRFDELIILDKFIHSSNYTVETSALQKYDSSKPYADVHFGTGFKEGEVKDLNLKCSVNCTFVIKLANTWYYYFSGAWRQSNGSYSQSILPSIIEGKFQELFFDENHELVIRCYFDSDGQTQVYLDEISIIVDTGSAAPATITGSVDLTTPVDLTTNYIVKITTNQGSAEVNVKSAAANPAAVTLDEIKQSIDDANVPGLAPAADDGNGHLVLMSSDTGSSAFISISAGTSNDALPIIWGFESTDTGEDASDSTYFDYTQITNWIRAKLGAPIVPVELTDEQIETCISNSIYWYNYYRNYKENIITTYLDGNPHDGWIVPTEVGDPDNIIEIIMKPLFPYTYYVGREDLMGNLYMQYFFHKYRSGYMDMLGDYYITVSTEKDISIVLGTYVKWEIVNQRLFIHPEPSVGLRIGIRFRSAISLEEINTNYFIKAYALAEAKEVLGTIRATFSGQIPGGAEMITLRATELIQEGKEEKDKLIDTMIKMSEPLGFTFG